MKPTEAELLGFPKPETTVQQAAQSIFVELDKLATAGTDGILGEQWGEFFRSRVNAIPEQLISYSSMILNAIDAANKEKAAAGGVNAPPTELEKHVHNLALATNITASVGIFWKVLHDYAQGKLRLRFPETAASIVANASDYLVQHYEKSYLGLLSAAAHSFGTRFGMDASAALQILYDQRQDQAGERRGAIDHGDDRCGVNFGHPAMMTSACAPSSGNPRLVSNVPVVPGPAVAPPSTPRMR
jgi:hypothetical protein